MAQATIDFYSPDERNGWLANFSLDPIVIRDETWQTVEHFYQAAKFPPGEIRTMIANAATPAAAKELANKHKHLRRPDWTRVSSIIMYNGIRAKFKQHAELREKLLATGDAEIRELVSADLKWGIGPDGAGENRMGRLLMALRSDLRGERNA